jgi:hypothetical protein
VLLRLLEADAKVRWGATPLIDIDFTISNGTPQEFLKSGHTATYYDAGRQAYQVVIGGHFNSAHPPGIRGLDNRFYSQQTR